jgi:Cu+-exporting ATPase
MVGDGTNDAASLAQSDVGLAVVSATDIARHASDIMLLNHDLRTVLGLSLSVSCTHFPFGLISFFLSRYSAALDLSKQAFKTIRRNFLWAILYNIVSIPLASGVLTPLSEYLFIPPALAGISELFSSLPVVMFSLQLYDYLPPVLSSSSSSSSSLSRISISS